MGLMCSVFDHKNQAINFWGDDAEYVLFQCKRCGHEEILCSYEGKVLVNDAFGQMALKKMMNDKEFSKACHIHSLFVKAETENTFNFKKLEKEYVKLRKQFNLTSNMRPACPVEMLKAGIWIDKKGEESNPKPKNKPVSKSKKRPMKTDLEPEQGEETVFIPRESVFQTNFNYDYKSKSSKGKTRKPPVDIERETLEELERLEKIYVEKENYEKAGEIHKKILKLKENKK